ncbi:hypothetical protein ERJ75_001545200 [Trypanosoma vivax]|nr:hypothetical protein ERJ75_001545200 [Trypanosoma vivax]
MHAPRRRGHPVATSAGKGQQVKRRISLRNVTSATRRSSRSRQQQPSACGIQPSAHQEQLFMDTLVGRRRKHRMPGEPCQPAAARGSTRPARPSAQEACQVLRSKPLKEKSMLFDRNTDRQTACIGRSTRIAGRPSANRQAADAGKGNGPGDGSLNNTAPPAARKQSTPATHRHRGARTSVHASSAVLNTEKRGSTGLQSENSF